MLRTVSGALTALLLSTSLVEADSTEDGKPDIFEISDGNSSIYVFGTVHILPDGASWERDILKEKLTKADRILFELDQDAPDFQMKTQIAMQQRMSNTSGQKLADYLSPELTEKLTTKVARSGLPPQMIDALDPWVLFLTISVGDMVSAGLNPNSGVETVLSGYVEEAGLDIEGLETVESQMDIFENTPFEEQVAMLEGYLKDDEDALETVMEMIDLWKNDNWEDLANSMNKFSGISPDLSYKLLEERNVKWAETFKDLLAKDETAFIAVGAGHLPGDKGVLTLMEEAGYTITHF